MMSSMLRRLVMMGVVWGAYTSSLYFVPALAAGQTPDQSTDDGLHPHLSAADRAAMFMVKNDRAAAMREWESLLASGLVSGHLLYNMGVVRAEMDEPGQAMALLLAARRWLPQDPEVNASLRRVHATVPDQLQVFIPGESSSSAAVLRGLVTALSPSAWTILAALLIFVGGCVFLACVMRKIHVAQPVVWSFVGLGIFSLGLSFASEFVRPVWGAVVTKQAPVSQAPGTESVFALNEGAPFRYKRQQGEWVEIVLSDGRSGWVRALDVRVIL
jgi:hypothetical protein